MLTWKQVPLNFQKCPGCIGQSTACIEVLFTQSIRVQIPGLAFQLALLGRGNQGILQRCGSQTLSKPYSLPKSLQSSACTGPCHFVFPPINSKNKIAGKYTRQLRLEWARDNRTEAPTMWVSSTPQQGVALCPPCNTAQTYLWNYRTLRQELFFNT